ncbi:Cytochrome c-type biogenesis protein CcmE [Candidatus Methylobacter favarea]|uniref:Cytochrome c-type biogenesis protein CcmE n=1 Tax=Candidatus Methylobacter favarea TaxID=2707345 RepID=A0A8S0X821_9GAMM|nr:cytochrome c maturation protein CcmE [Candidatus Methylobacter favarea]CAA9890630.1 Cytochrome c-type biogenesis protein CcmE [Candidatus Methylobacter favarea]
MKPARRQRLMLIALMVLGAGLATAFALKSFNDNLMYFFSTTDVVEGKAPRDALFRLGGMVIKGSVERPGDGLMVRFKLTDFSKDVTVEYTGILPDLFREGQGIVAHGRLNRQGVFIAEEVLAKHDENYMPPEVAGSLKNKSKTLAGQLP